MIRSFVFNIIFWPILSAILIVMYPFTLFFTQKQTTVLVYRNLSRLMLFCLKYIVSVNFSCKNLNLLKDELKKGPVIIGCNHQSVWETIIFPMFFDELTIVVKKELFDIPIAGLYFKRLECIPVDRASPVLAIRSLLKFGKCAHQKKQSILIFPNGTRSAANELVEFKTGIYALYKSLNIPVIPTFVNSGTFWPRRSFKKKKGTIVLEFKNKIKPGLNKDEFMKNFEQAINS